MRYTVDEGQAGRRFDELLSELAGLSRSRAAKLIENGDATLNARPVSKKQLAKVGDIIELTLPEPEPSVAIAENIPLNIIYEDADIIVINKPSGMVVHPAPGNFSGTLVNALLYHSGDSLSGIGGVLRPGIVHRIDKDTSGLLVVAKNDAAHNALSAQLQEHGIVREYHALVNGGFKNDSGTVDLPIGRHPEDRKKMAVIRDGTAREAITHYEVIERYGAISYLKLRLETGRTHQIRVHMSHLGHPLLGDAVYGGGKTAFEKRHAPLLSGQALHAKHLSFRHPTTGEIMDFECPLPDNFEELLSILRKSVE